MDLQLNVTKGNESPAAEFRRAINFPPYCFNLLPLLHPVLSRYKFFYWLICEKFFNNDWPKFESLKIKFCIVSALQSVKQLNKPL